jgi:putative transposase
MERRQAFKFELMPSGEQQRMMRRFAGSVRYIYNHALALQKEMYEATGRSHTRYQLDKLLTIWKQETPWLSETPAHALQQALVDLDKAYQNFFKKRAQFPKFKKKGQRTSYRESDPKTITFDQANNRIRLPKIGWVRYRNSRDVLGTIKNVTVSESAGKWFVSISTLRIVEQPVHASSSIVGIDMGVKQFATLSDGEVIDPANAGKKYQKRMRLLQRRLSRKQKFSQNWKKAKAAVAKLHRKIAATRSDFIHKVTSTISKSHAVVCIEDLQVKNMSASAAGTIEKKGKMVKQKSGLNKSILDQSWFETRRQLEYKQHWLGGEVIAVPPQHTSQRCPDCQHVSPDNRKTQSKFVCVSCGFAANADFVGALNILAAGHAVLACRDTSPAIGALAQEPTEGIVCESV